MHAPARFHAVFIFLLPIALACLTLSGLVQGESVAGDMVGPLVAVVTLAGLSRACFTSVVPGVAGWLIGMFTLVGVTWVWHHLAFAALPPSHVFDDTGWSGLLGMLVVQGAGVLTLYACESAMTRRFHDERPRGTWCLASGLALYALLSGFISVVRGGELLGALPWLMLPLLAVAWLAGEGVARLLFPQPGRWPVDGATVLNTLFGYGSFVLSCLSLPVFLPLVLLLPGRRERWIAMPMRWAMRWVFWCAPTITWRCDGALSELDHARVVVANHEGMLDILAACSLPGLRTLLAKTWVFRAFPLGVAARAAGLRNSDTLTPDDYQEGMESSPLADPGLGIFVFPEGRRSRRGVMDRFRPGAFVLARSLGAPVVPVALAGSRLGIMPGSLWIRPSLLRSRVLPPLRHQPEESVRQFAARCREAIALAHFALLKELLVQPRMARNRLHVFTGLAPELFARARREQVADGWRTLLAAARDTEDDWLFLGCGWSALPVTLRQLLPASRILAVETDAQRRGVARHAWWRPEGDTLVSDPKLMALPERFAGVVCLLPSADPVVWSLMGALSARLSGAAVIVVAGEADCWRRLVPALEPVATGGGLVALRCA